MRHLSLLTCLTLTAGLSLCQSVCGGDCAGASAATGSPTTVYTYSVPVQYSSTAAYSVQPYVVGTSMYAPMQVQLVPSGQASQASASASASGLESLLITLLGRLIDRELPPTDPDPPAGDCTDERLDAIEDFLKNQNQGFTPADCSNTATGNVPTEWPGPAAFAAAADQNSQATSALTEKVDELSGRIQELTAAVNRLADK